MRIIAGSAKGRRLQSPVGNDVRPTTDIVKEAVFSIVQFELEGCSFLDAFAGSGQMGLEALSRGAETVCFVDSSHRSMSVVRKNIELCSFDSYRVVTVVSDTVRFLSGTKEQYDIVFLDPPYMTGLLQKALAASARVVKDGGIIVCEHPAEEQLPEITSGFSLEKNRRYGKIMISVYRKNES